MRLESVENDTLYIYKFQVYSLQWWEGRYTLIYFLSLVSEECTYRIWTASIFFNQENLKLPCIKKF